MGILRKFERINGTKVDESIYKQFTVSQIPVTCILEGHYYGSASGGTLIVSNKVPQGSCTHNLAVVLQFPSSPDSVKLLANIYFLICKVHERVKMFPSPDYFL